MVLPDALIGNYSELILGVSEESGPFAQFGFFAYAQNDIECELLP